MPNYLYQHPETEETIELFQHMDEPHNYVDESGQLWNRIFTIPNAASNTAKIDIYSAKDFSRRTADKKMTFGEAWDESARLSAAREEKEGVNRDPVKLAHFDNYSKTRKGLKHHLDTRPQVVLKRAKKKK